MTSDGTRTYAYDAENRLVSVTQGATVLSFAYDPDGARYKKTQNGQATVYVGRHYERNTALGDTTTHYHLLGSPVALRTATGVAYLYQDRLGSAVAATNGSTVTYWPFGNQRSATGALPTDRSYTDQRLEASVGLYDYGARFYDPLLGRFVQPDAIVPEPGNPQDLNRYAYVRNNPLRYVDPTGNVPDMADPRDDDPELPTGQYGCMPLPLCNALAAPSEEAIAAFLAEVEAQVAAARVRIPRLVYAADDADTEEAQDGAGGGGAGSPPPGDGGEGGRRATERVAKGGTYILRDPETGQVMRTGRSRNLRGRAGDHRRDAATEDLRFEIDKLTDDYAAQRGREQIIHERYRPPLNKISPISARNPNRARYLDAGRRLGD